MTDRTLVALPVYNEEAHIPEVLTQVLAHAEHVLVVNDGSSDGTAAALRSFEDRVCIETHTVNQGYGAALRTGFRARRPLRLRRAGDDRL